MRKSEKEAVKNVISRLIDLNVYNFKILLGRKITIDFCTETLTGDKAIIYHEDIEISRNDALVFQTKIGKGMEDLDNFLNLKTYIKERS